MRPPAVTTLHINPSLGKKVFILSDFHLDFDDPTSFEREKRICQWLDEKFEETETLFILGDLFDFWYEYKNVVPKGFTRLLSRLIRLTENGKAVYLVPGNHDLWLKDYLKIECGVEIIEGGIILKSNGQTLYMAHGDQIDKKIYWLRKLFASKWANWLFRCIHPDISFLIAKKWSESSRKKSSELNDTFQGLNEVQIHFTHALLKKENLDFAIYGHRHLTYDILVDGCRIINLGEWFTSSNYCEWDGDTLLFIQSTHHENYLLK